MFTIKHAARVVGTTEATLRTWERRYEVVAPERSEGGYRIYDPAAIATLTAMRKLVDAGWSPGRAATAIRSGEIPVDGGPLPIPSGATDTAASASCTRAFLDAAARMDVPGLQAALGEGLSLGSFEHVVDTWLLPTLVALGEGWARGDIDVAGEHLASHCVLRRLSAAYEAAGPPAQGPRVVVALPPGSHHELGALAFATALRRQGIDVLYLGADVPEASWLSAVRAHGADAAVVCVVTAADQPSARNTVRLLKAHHPELFVASGGTFGNELGGDVHELPYRISDGARELATLLQARATGQGAR